MEKVTNREDCSRYALSAILAFFNREVPNLAPALTISEISHTLDSSDLLHFFQIPDLYKRAKFNDDIKGVSVTKEEFRTMINKSHRYAVQIVGGAENLYGFSAPWVHSIAFLVTGRYQELVDSYSEEIKDDYPKKHISRPNLDNIINRNNCVIIGILS